LFPSNLSFPLPFIGSFALPHYSPLFPSFLFSPEPGNEMIILIITLVKQGMMVKEDEWEEL